MPNFLSDMAEYHRQTTKVFLKGRKTMGQMAVRKGSPRRSRAKTQSGSPPSGSSPPTREFYRPVVCHQTPACMTDVGLQENRQICQTIDIFRCEMEQPEMADGVSGQNPSTAVPRSTVSSHQAPAPASLPRPPSSWMAEDKEKASVTEIVIDTSDKNVGSVLSNQLKMLLKVQG